MDSPILSKRGKSVSTNEDFICANQNCSKEIYLLKIKINQSERIIEETNTFKQHYKKACQQLEHELFDLKYKHQESEDEISRLKQIIYNYKNRRVSEISFPNNNIFPLQQQEEKEEQEIISFTPKQCKSQSSIIHKKSQSIDHTNIDSIETRQSDLDIVAKKLETIISLQNSTDLTVKDTQEKVDTIVYEKNQLERQIEMLRDDKQELFEQNVHLKTKIESLKTLLQQIKKGHVIPESFKPEKLIKFLIKCLKGDETNLDQSLSLIQSFQQNSTYDDLSPFYEEEEETQIMGQGTTATIKFTNQIKNNKYEKQRTYSSPPYLAEISKKINEEICEQASQENISSNLQSIETPEKFEKSNNSQSKKSNTGQKKNQQDLQKLMQEIFQLKHIVSNINEKVDIGLQFQHQNQKTPKFINSNHHSINISQNEQKVSQFSPTKMTQDQNKLDNQKIFDNANQQIQEKQFTKNRIRTFQHKSKVQQKTNFVKQRKKSASKQKVNNYKIPLTQWFQHTDDIDSPISLNAVDKVVNANAKQYKQKLYSELIDKLQIKKQNNPFQFSTLNISQKQQQSQEQITKLNDDIGNLKDKVEMLEQQ